MNTAVITPSDRIAAFRSRHLIDLVTEQHPHFGLIYRCQRDGLRIHPTRNGRWRHDSAEIVTLLDSEYGGAFGQPPEPTAAEIAREDAFVNGRLTFEWHGHAVEVDLEDETTDDEWTDRESMPEFNGAFR